MKLKEHATGPIRTAASCETGMRKTSIFEAARKCFHAALLEGGLLRMTARKTPKRGLPAKFPSNADGDSATSIAIAQSIYDQIQSATIVDGKLAGQTFGTKFDQVTRAFIQETFSRLKAIRPGKWDYSPEGAILGFEEYRHFAELSEFAAQHPEFAVLSGRDYVLTPDVLIVRKPESDEAINAGGTIVDNSVALRSALRRRNNRLPILHASISCKWTLLSDRAQDTRPEAINLCWNRTGRAAHIAVVTGEPLPYQAAWLR